MKTFFQLYHKYQLSRVSSLESQAKDISWILRQVWRNETEEKREPVNDPGNLLEM